MSRSLVTRTAAAGCRVHQGQRATRRGVASFKGVFVPLTTPFDEKQNIAYDQLKYNLKEYEKIPFGGYLVSGTNGEAPFLNPEERVQLVKFVRENTAKDKVVIGGSTAESTEATCKLTEAIAKAGADGALVMPPFYFRKRMTEEALITHYTKIAENCDLPVIVYNNTFVSGIDVSSSTLAKLAKHPNIRGVKDSDIRKCAGTVIDTKGLNFDVLIGSAGYLLPALISGCSGGINGLAGVLGKELCDIYSLFNEGRWEEAAKLHVQIAKPDSLLLAEMGAPGLKAAMDILGLKGGNCRKPILPLSDADKLRIRSCLKESGFLSQ